MPFRLSGGTLRFHAPPADDQRLPGRPAAVSVSVSGTSVTAAFSAPADVGNPPADGQYRMQLRVSGAASYTLSTVTTALTATLDGLTAGISYDLALQAHNSSGYGDAYTATFTAGGGSPTGQTAGWPKPYVGGAGVRSTSQARGAAGNIDFYVLELEWDDTVDAGNTLTAAAKQTIATEVAYAAANNLRILVRLRCGVNAPDIAKNADGTPMTWAYSDSGSDVTGTMGRWWAAGYQQAYADWINQLAPILDAADVIGGVTISMTCTGVYSEPLLRQFSGTTNAATVLAEFATSPTTVTARTLMGLSNASDSSQNPTSQVALVEAAMGKHADFVLLFQQWGDTFTSSSALAQYATGRNGWTGSSSTRGIYVTFAMKYASGSGYNQVVAGTWDSWITSSWDYLDSLGVPVRWIPNKELNGAQALTAVSDGTEATAPAETVAFLRYLAGLWSTWKAAHPGTLVDVVPLYIRAGFATERTTYCPSPWPAAFTKIGMTWVSTNFTGDWAGSGMPDFLAANPGVTFVMPITESSTDDTPHEASTTYASIQSLASFAAAHPEIPEIVYYLGHQSVRTDDAADTGANISTAAALASAFTSGAFTATSTPGQTRTTAQAAAAYNAADLAAHRTAMALHAQAFTRTASHFSFNPYQTLSSSGRLLGDDALDLVLQGNMVDQLGHFAVVENNSLLVDSTGAMTRGGDYQAIYDLMASQHAGADLVEAHIQTASISGHGGLDVYQACLYAIAHGVGSVEMPVGWTDQLTAAQIASVRAGLLANVETATGNGGGGGDNGGGGGGGGGSTTTTFKGRSGKNRVNIVAFGGTSTAKSGTGQGTSSPAAYAGNLGTILAATASGSIYKADLVSGHVNWGDIDPGPGLALDTKQTQDWLDACSAAGMGAMLRIQGGLRAPLDQSGVSGAWGQTAYTWGNSYFNTTVLVSGGNATGTGLQPVPWDPKVQTAIADFYTRLAAAFAGHDALQVVVMSMALGAGGETVLDDASWWGLPTAVGDFTYAKYLHALQQQVLVACAAFPQHTVALAIDPAMRISDATAGHGVTARLNSQFVQDFCDWATGARTDPSWLDSPPAGQVAVQQNGANTNMLMTAAASANEVFSEDGTQTARTTIRSGVQESVAAGIGGYQMGMTDNSATTLGDQERVWAAAVNDFKGGSGYLEIYQTLIVDPTTKAALTKLRARQDPRT